MLVRHAESAPLRAKGKRDAEKRKEKCPMNAVLLFKKSKRFLLSSKREIRTPQSAFASTIRFFPALQNGSSQERFRTKNGCNSARKTVAIPPETHLLSYPPDKFGKFCREVGTFSTESADVFRQRSARFSAKAPTPHPLHKPSEWDTCLLSLGNYL